MAVQRKEIKKKRKIWYGIKASKEFKFAVIGETISDNPGKLVGRTVASSLSNLTNDGRMQNIRVTFEITDVKEGFANTTLVGYELLPMYIKRVVKLTKERIDDSFEISTKDGYKLRLKPIFITKHFTKRQVLTDLRKKSREYFKELLGKENYESFLNSLIRHQVQYELKNRLNKIYPMGVTELRKMEVIGIPVKSN